MTLIVQNTIASSGPFSPLVPKKTYVSYNRSPASIVEDGSTLILFCWSHSKEILECWIKLLTLINSSGQV